MDFTTGEITAIGASWDEANTVRVWLLGKHTLPEMLAGFLRMYDEADIVTGHYIRKHDLPVLNGALLEQGMRPLGAKMASDTKLDLVRSRYMSMSQENLGAMFGISHRKEHMSQVQWREANRLTPKGLYETRRRVAGDVRQHKELRRKLVEVGALGPPKLWRGP